MAGVELLELHGPDGQTAWVNTHGVSSLRAPVGDDLKHFTKGTRCLVVMSNAKFVATVESCAEIRDRMTGERR